MEPLAPEATTTPAAAPEAPAATPAAPTPAAAPVAAPSEPAKPQERSDVIRAAMKAAKEPADGKSLRERMIANGTIKPAGERPRAPDGKFAPAAPAQLAAAQQPKPAPTPAEVLAMPKSIRKELEAHWKQTPSELQKAMIEREQAYERGVAQYRTQAEQAQAVLAEFRPYEQIMRMTGGTPQTALRSILPTMAVLTTGAPQEKAFVMAQAMRNYGVPIEHVAQVMQQGVGPAAQTDPVIAQLAQQVSQLTQTFHSQQQAQQAAEDARLSAVAEAFGRGKEHFNELRPQMWSLLMAQSEAEKNGLPGPLGSAEQTAAMSEQQWVEAAFNAAIRLNPALYESTVARQREEAARAEREKATAAAQAARAASMSVRGAPSSAASIGANTDPKDRRSVIASAIRGRLQ